MQSDRILTYLVQHGGNRQGDLTIVMPSATTLNHVTRNFVAQGWRQGLFTLTGPESGTVLKIKDLKVTLILPNPLNI